MRSISYSQAHECEQAKTDATECRCRCKGQFHGAARIAAAATEAAYYGLDLNDPHRVFSSAERRRVTQQQKRITRREAWLTQINAARAARGAAPLQ